jgi:N-acetylmuramic acid 6-phosphate etherase
VFLGALEAVHAVLTEAAVRDQVAALVAQEERVYRARRRNTYFAERLAIDVLTDTTERSPTFCIPTFRKFDDTQAAESWSFLFLPYDTTPAAWEGLLKRPLAPVEWDLETVRAMVGDEEAERVHSVLRHIGRNEILRFRIGMDGLPYRPVGRGDSVTAILCEEEIDALLQPGGFYRQRLEEAHREGAAVAVLFFGSAAGVERLRGFLSSWQVAAMPVLVPLPETDLWLNAPLRVAAKMVLNALSTCTMVRLGRVMGNVMIWVVPSNLKLIDRSTRYIQSLTGLPYEKACVLLHEAMDYVAPRMQAGKEYPAAVGLAVNRVRYGCSFPEAEARLYAELGIEPPAAEQGEG